MDVLFCLQLWSLVPLRIVQAEKFSKAQVLLTHPSGLLQAAVSLVSRAGLYDEEAGYAALSNGCF
jgi:hypothetical protein